jgi:hypothetical protein
MIFIFKNSQNDVLVNPNDFDNTNIQDFINNKFTDTQ